MFGSDREDLEKCLRISMLEFLPKERLRTNNMNIEDKDITQIHLSVNLLLQE